MFIQQIEQFDAKLFARKYIHLIININRDIVIIKACELFILRRIQNTDRNGYLWYIFF